MKKFLFFAGLMAWPFLGNHPDITTEDVFLSKLAIVVDIALLGAFILSGLAGRLLNDIAVLIGLS